MAYISVIWTNWEPDLEDVFFLTYYRPPTRSFKQSIWISFRNILFFFFCNYHECKQEVFKPFSPYAQVVSQLWTKQRDISPQHKAHNWPILFHFLGKRKSHKETQGARRCQCRRQGRAVQERTPHLCVSSWSSWKMHSWTYDGFEASHGTIHSFQVEGKNEKNTCVQAHSKMTFRSPSLLQSQWLTVLMINVCPQAFSVLTGSLSCRYIHQWPFHDGISHYVYQHKLCRWKRRTYWKILWT